VDIRRIAPEDTWPLRHRVMWPDQPFDFVKVAEDHHGLHYGLFVQNQLVSVVSLFIKGGDAQFRKLATEVAEQGKGYGSHLLRHVLHEASTQGANRIWCNARAEKASYYERFGLTKTTNTYVKEGIEFVVMEHKKKHKS